MISGHGDFPAVREFPEPIIEIKDGSGFFAKHREVARMDEDVTVGYVELPV